MKTEPAAWFLQPGSSSHKLKTYSLSPVCIRGSLLLEANQSLLTLPETIVYFTNRSRCVLYEKLLGFPCALCLSLTAAADKAELIINVFMVIVVCFVITLHF